MDYTDRGILQQLFVDSLPDCSLVLLDIDGNVLTWNAGARAILGYTEEEIVGRHFSCFYTEKEVAEAKPSTSLANALAQGRHEETGRRIRKDGTGVETQDVLIPLFDPQKKLVAFGNLTRDVGRSARGTAASPATAGSQKIEPVANEGRKKILLVDDDEAVRAVALGLLTSLGYQVLVAASGSEALDMLTRIADIDLLFTDVVMPGGMDGGEIAEKARSLRPGLKVLFTSGYFEGALVSKGSIAESTQFLVKPYRKRDLAQKMEEALNAQVALT